ncbi:MAG: GNAT family N-acetyltransferase [Saprospiraceae bacterium]|nr:GNAT family N-acetyltransferase [Saprospiraceae bacterium]MCB0542697.1 GNAT family N-acetyltransferase [Saprospiraceae bacterium]MCB0573259.1 GNAT family N-acetyltransferase [Saprospiraceae bacterium]MCB9306094.1 GNAT family N-acetyltransferase [Lewinellaceae bacterium]MCB9356214.1 GNAT family N-acetyltransferase [Lewinellaceae bacterium]
MSTWIHDSTELNGTLVRLVPLKTEHFDALAQVASDKRIWAHYTLDGSNEGRLRTALNDGLLEKQKGAQFPFVIFEKATDRVLGSTRLLELQPAHRKLEIGWTWLHPDHWGTAVNLECKLLLLSFCFETLGTTRVQLRTDENNIRSRKAIEKIGARFEGILRHDLIRDDGTHRNSAYFSIIEPEWEGVKKALSEKLRIKAGW